MNLVNARTGLGIVGEDPTLEDVPYLTADPDLADIQAMWSGSALAERIVCTPVGDILSAGFEFSPVGEQADGELPDKVKAYLEARGWPLIRWEAMVKARIFGGAAAIVTFGEGENLQEPVRADAIQTIQGFVVADRYELRPLQWSLQIGPYYNRPILYSLHPWVPGAPAPTEEDFRTRGQLIHASRVIPFVGKYVPERLSDGYARGWSDSVLRAVRQKLIDLYRVHRGVARLVVNIAERIIKDPSLFANLDTLTDAEFNALLLRRKMGSSFNGDRYLPQDATLEWTAPPTTGVRDLVLETMVALAGATSPGMPVEKLFGIAPPGGMDGAGEYVRDNYWGNLDQARTYHIIPNERRAIDLALAAKDGPTGGRPVTYMLTGGAFKIETEQERAQRLQTESGAANTYVQMGALHPMEVRASLKKAEQTLWQLEDQYDDELAQGGQGGLQMPGGDLQGQMAAMSGGDDEPPSGGAPPDGGPGPRNDSDDWSDDDDAVAGEMEEWAGSEPDADESESDELERTDAEEKAGVDADRFVPPESVQSAARAALERRKEGQKGGLSSKEAGQQGIGSGVVRAAQLASGKAVSPRVVRRINAFFGRFGRFKDAPLDSKGKQAYQLWGGAAAERWAAALVDDMDAARMDAGEWTRFDADWNEDLHPRNHGKFAKKGEGESAGGQKVELKKPLGEHSVEELQGLYQQIYGKPGNISNVANLKTWVKKGLDAEGGHAGKVAMLKEHYKAITGKETGIPHEPQLKYAVNQALKKAGKEPISDWQGFYESKSGTGPEKAPKGGTEHPPGSKKVTAKFADGTVHEYVKTPDGNYYMPGQGGQIPEAIFSAGMNTMGAKVSEEPLEPPATIPMPALKEKVGEIAADPGLKPSEKTEAIDTVLAQHHAAVDAQEGTAGAAKGPSGKALADMSPDELNAHLKGLDLPGLQAAYQEVHGVPTTTTTAANLKTWIKQGLSAEHKAQVAHLQGKLEQATGKKTSIAKVPQLKHALNNALKAKGEAPITDWSELETVAKAAAEKAPAKLETAPTISPAPAKSPEPAPEATPVTNAGIAAVPADIGGNNGHSVKDIKVGSADDYLSNPIANKAKLEEITKGSLGMHSAFKQNFADNINDLIKKKSKKVGAHTIEQDVVKLSTYIADHVKKGGDPDVLEKLTGVTPEMKATYPWAFDGKAEFEHIGTHKGDIQTKYPTSFAGMKALKYKGKTATDLHNPSHPLVFKGDHPHTGKPLNGVKLSSVKEGFWTGAKDTIQEPGELKTNGKKAASGIIMVEPDGRMWVVEPKDHFGGYEHTFPKGGHETGLSLQQNALKEAWEESGLQAEITGHLGDFEGDTSMTRYYVAKRVGGDPKDMGPESQSVKLLTPEQAATHLNKERDKKILEAVKAHMAKGPQQAEPVAVEAPAAAPEAPAAASAPSGQAASGIHPDMFSPSTLKPQHVKDFITAKLGSFDPANPVHVELKKDVEDALFSVSPASAKKFAVEAYAAEAAEKVGKQSGGPVQSAKPATNPEIAKWVNDWENVSPKQIDTHLATTGHSFNQLKGGIYGIIDEPISPAEKQAKIEALIKSTPPMFHPKPAIKDSPEPQKVNAPLVLPKLDPANYKDATHSGTASSLPVPGYYPKDILEHGGNKFMLKSAKNAQAAHNEQAGGQLAAAIMPHAVIPAEYASPSEFNTNQVSSGHGTIQPMLEGATPLSTIVGNKKVGHPDLSKLSHDQLGQILATGIPSWMVGDHDANAEQYLVDKDGSIKKVDFGQAFKFGVNNTEGLDPDHNPNSKPYPAYHLPGYILNQIEGGKLPQSLLSHPEVTGALNTALNLPDSELKKAAATIAKGGTVSEQEALAGLQKHKAELAQKWIAAHNKAMGIVPPSAAAAKGVAPQAGAYVPNYPVPLPQDTHPISAMDWHKSTILEKEGGGASGAGAYWVSHPGAPGEKFLVKSEVPYKAEAAHSATQILDHFGAGIEHPELSIVPPTAVPAELKKSGEGITIQKGSEGKNLAKAFGTKTPDMSKFTTDQHAQILASGIQNWIVGDHDAHAGQYLIKPDGNLVKVDFGQAFKHTLNDSAPERLHEAFHPNGTYGEAEPLPNQLLKAIKSGKVSPDVLEHPLVKSTIAEAAHIPESAIDEAMSGYHSPSGKGSSEVAAAVKKKVANVKEDFEKLYSKIAGKPVNLSSGTVGQEHYFEKPAAGAPAKVAAPYLKSYHAQKSAGGKSAFLGNYLANHNIQESDPAHAVAKAQLEEIAATSFPTASGKAAAMKSVVEYAHQGKKYWHDGKPVAYGTQEGAPAKPKVSATLHSVPTPAGPDDAPKPTPNYTGQHGGVPKWMPAPQYHWKPSDHAADADHASAETLKVSNGPAYRVSTKPGVTAIPPKRDEANMAIKEMSALPLRSLPTSLKQAPSGHDGSDWAKIEKDVKKNLDKVAPDAAAGISKFTGSSFGDIRKYSQMGHEAFSKKYGASQANNYKGTLDAINKAFEVTAPTPGLVFRGISGVPSDVMQKLLTQDTVNQMGPASNSYSVQTAMSFASAHHATPGSHSVIFVTHQKSGIPVKALSHFASENEVLSPGSSRFRVLQRHRWDQNPNTYIIEVEEI